MGGSIRPRCLNELLAELKEKKNSKVTTARKLNDIQTHLSKVFAQATFVSKCLIWHHADDKASRAVQHT